MTRARWGLLAGVTSLLLVASAPAAVRTAETCPLSRLSAGEDYVVLTEDDLLGAANALAEENAARIAQIDAQLRRGAFGDPGSRQARERAHILARVSLPNLYNYLFGFANDPGRVYESGPGPLERVAAEFVEPLLFPVARLRRARMGRGRVCLQYDLDETGEGWTSMGGKAMRYRVSDVGIEDQERRVLAVEFDSATAGRIEVLVAEHYSFKVVRVQSTSPRAPYDLFAVRSLDGVWVRHHGVHRPEAFAYWVSSPDPNPIASPSTPMAGVRIYFPGLKFTLPLFLPDIDLEDLRPLGLPMPFLSTSYFARGANPSWLETSRPLEFKDWVGVGELPTGVRELFPNNPRPAVRAHIGTGKGR
jgi:hypothetical protein